MQKDCIICGLTYYKKKNESLFNWEKHKFCSQKCRCVWLANDIVKRLPDNRGFKHSEITKEKMSQSHVGKNTWSKGRKHLLTTINKIRGYRHTEEAKEKISNALKMRVGEKNPGWKGGITPERTKLWFSDEYKNLRKSCFERDNYKCKMPLCDSEEKYLEMHHIKKFSEYKDLRFSLSNVITLCKHCHNLTKRKETEFEHLFII